jgi:hypothetical protein
LAPFYRTFFAWQEEGLRQPGRVVSDQLKGHQVEHPGFMVEPKPQAINQQDRWPGPEVEDKRQAGGSSKCVSEVIAKSSFRQPVSVSGLLSDRLMMDEGVN